MTKEEFIEHCIYNTEEEIEEYIKKEEEFAKRYNVEPVYDESQIPHAIWHNPFENRMIEKNAKEEKMPIREFVLLAREKGCSDDLIECLIVDYNGTLDCKDISVSAAISAKLQGEIADSFTVIREFFGKPRRR